MRKKLRCILLCEDVEQEHFFRPILERHFGKSVRVKRGPNNRGGASFVLRNLEPEVQYVRRYHQESVALLVAIDGNSKGLVGRLAEIRGVANLTGEAWEERIAVCVPCRSIETWEMWLCGNREVDEKTPYKQKVERGTMNARQAVGAWFTATLQDLKSEEALLPALAHGRKEVARLRQLAKL